MYISTVYVHNMTDTCMYTHVHNVELLDIYCIISRSPFYKKHSDFVAICYFPINHTHNVIFAYVEVVYNSKTILHVHACTLYKCTIKFIVTKSLITT